MNIEELLIFYRKEGTETEKAINTVKSWASDRNIPAEVFQLNEEMDLLPKEEYDTALAISVGGDGTFLGVADRVAEISIPLLGINVGSLGFLTSLKAGNITEGLDSLKKSKFEKRDLMRLGCRVFREDREITDKTALNEISFVRKEVTGFAEFDLKVNGKEAGTYAGDGIIVTTPTGSTAHSLSCGGPLILPSTPALGVTPMNAHQLTARPFVCPKDSEIEVSPNTEVTLLADGDSLKSVTPQEVIKIGKSPIPTKVIVPGDKTNFFSILHNKLGWVGNEERKNDL